MTTPFAPELLKSLDQYLIDVAARRPKSDDATMVAAHHCRADLLTFLESLFAQISANVLSIPQPASMAVLQGRIANFLKTTHGASQGLRSLATIMGVIAYNWDDLIGSEYIEHDELFSALVREHVPNLLQSLEGYLATDEVPEIRQHVGRIIVQWRLVFPCKKISKKR